MNLEGRSGKRYQKASFIEVDCGRLFFTPFLFISTNYDAMNMREGWENLIDVVDNVRLRSTSHGNSYTAYNFTIKKKSVLCYLL